MKPQSNNKYIWDQRPMLIYWELTRACDLACKHCRASALLHRNPLELSLPESRKLLQEIKEFGNPTPHVVVTGGDPLKHPDMFPILEMAQEIDVPVSLSPSGTGTLTLEAFQRFKELGVQAVSLSLDGATAESHDAFRGVPGCFDMTLEAAEFAREVGMPLQINTLVSSGTVGELEAMYELVKKLGIIRWSVFFLIGVGRGTDLRELEPDHAEEVMLWLGAKARTAPFAIKTTEAPHYRRVMIEEMRRQDVKVPMSKLPISRGFGIRDGNGILFISHKGDVYPSGFLPVKADNVRRTHIRDIYRHNPLFHDLRNPDEYEGKCGDCEFRHICGGSRARAYVATGNPMGSDPLCPYQPKPRKRKSRTADTTTVTA